LNLDEIVDAFSFFDSWEDKYRFVIDMGKSASTLPESERNEENIIRGCQSQVWLVASYDQASDTLNLQIDSDAHIVRGLAAIVLACYNGKSPQEIVDHDMDGLFAELSLMEHLSPTRGNGLRAMVGAIKTLAAQHL
jgi:cysteine desulfuration protein SufE